MEHVIEWRAAAPLWDRDASQSGKRRAQRPAILRFTNERFMDDLAAELSGAPAVLGEREAPRRETWRDGAAVAAVSERRAETSHLYQPVHGRYYLVAGSLVCRKPGLPDRAVQLKSRERVSFVLRRLVPDDLGATTIAGAAGKFREYAWELSGRDGRWIPVPEPESYSPPSAEGAPAEERHPLFPTHYKVGEQPRTLHVGFIPVASRESFQAAPALSPLGGTASELAFDPLADVRSALFEARVVDALESLRRLYADNPAGNSYDEAVEALLFVLVDLRQLLRDHLPRVHDALASGVLAGGSTSAEAALLGALRGTNFAYGRTWAAALVTAATLESGLLDGTLVVRTNAVTGGLDRGGVGLVISTFEASAIAPRMRDALAASPAPALTSAELDVPKYEAGSGAYYVIRFVYERPSCRPAHRPIVSAPSRAFTLAPYFDPDAPVRPLNISMPVDTSIRGLRRYPRAVSFLLSNQLRAQLQRVQGIKLADLDSGAIGPSGEVNLGMICSFSIPIITIAALILLMIIVSLLNIVFWWLPFLKICFPLRLKAS